MILDRVWNLPWLINKLKSLPGKYSGVCLAVLNFDIKKRPLLWIDISR